MDLFPSNSKICPEGLCPIFLVYCFLPRHARRIPEETQVMPSKDIDRGCGSSKNIKIERASNSPKIIDLAQRRGDIGEIAYVTCWSTCVGQQDDDESMGGTICFRQHSRGDGSSLSLKRAGYLPVILM